jgi:hypothetical protein
MSIDFEAKEAELQAILNADTNIPKGIIIELSENEAPVGGVYVEISGWVEDVKNVTVRNAVLGHAADILKVTVTLHPDTPT